MSTPVIFRKDRLENGYSPVVAVLPTIPGSPGLMTCYAHVGQHGSCSLDWYRGTRPAKPAEYADLYAELRSQGYRDLQVRHRITPEMREERNAAERSP